MKSSMEALAKGPSVEGNDDAYVSAPKRIRIRSREALEGGYGTGGGVVAKGGAVRGQGGEPPGRFIAKVLFLFV